MQIVRKEIQLADELWRRRSQNIVRLGRHSSAFSYEAHDSPAVEAESFWTPAPPQVTRIGATLKFTWQKIGTINTKKMLSLNQHRR